MQNVGWVILFFQLFFSSFGFAAEYGGNERFLSSLSLLNDLQNPHSCLKNPKFSGQCSDILSQLVKDDEQHRLFVFKSMAPSCKAYLGPPSSSGVHKVVSLVKPKEIQDFNHPDLLQRAFQTNKMKYLGEYTHENAKKCMLRPETKNNSVVAKFYYYAARLNETAGKIAQEQVIIDRYLNEKSKTKCPNEYLLAAARDTCEKALTCSQQETFEQLAARVPQEEELYLQTKTALTQIPENCDKDESCKKQKDALSALLAGLLEKNPWFLNEDFNSQKSKNSTKIRLEQYLKLARENLQTQQGQLEKAAMCIQTSNSEECKIDEVREILAITEDLPHTTGGLTATEKILNNHMNYQSCLEDASLARNRASGVVSDALKNAGLGLAVLPIGARWAAAKAGKMVLTEAAALMGADVALNVLSSRDSWKAVGEKCFSSDHMAFQFKMLPQNEICQNQSAALSPGAQETSACLINAGLSTLSALPFVGIGYNVVRYSQTAGIWKSAATPLKDAAHLTKTQPEAVVTNPTGTATGRRTADVTEQIERRQGGVLKVTSCAECRSESVIEHAAMPNLPKSMRILEGEKIDGSKSLYYKHSEKLKDGSWVATVREFQVDDITGTINANYPAGRELFEKIALEKAGKAHFAFFDVGSLGFVNKQFKAGSEAGDRYLKGVADKIREVGGSKVTLARTGGDEFGLIIDETDPAKAKALVKQIQESIRLDLKGDAKKIFFEEKVVRAQEFREALAKLQAEYPEGVSAEQKAQLLARIEELAKVQQPDVSIGVTQIGLEDRFVDLAARTEEQAKKMKIATALQFARSAAKYGSKETPNARPKPMYLAEVADPTSSPSWYMASKTTEAASAIDSLRVMSTSPKEEILRFSDMSVVRFEDELGRSIYKTERFFTDPATGKRVAVISEIPTRGATELLDGTHSEGQRLITGFIDSQPNSFFVMPKLRSLKFLNYFESGTQAGDTILEAVADLIKKNTRPYDLNFKLNGADFLMGVKNKSPQDMKVFYEKVNEQLKTHPKVVEALAKESSALAAKLEKAKALNDVEMVAEVQQRIQDLQNFNLDLQFQLVQKTELSAQPTLKEIQQKFDDKFHK